VNKLTVIRDAIEARLKGMAPTVYHHPIVTVSKSPDNIAGVARAKFPRAYLLTPHGKSIRMVSGQDLKFDVSAPFTVEVWRYLRDGEDEQTVADEIAADIIKLIYSDEWWGAQADAGGTTIREVTYHYFITAMTMVRVQFDVNFWLDAKNP
jgi:hypothetical protein